VNSPTFALQTPPLILIHIWVTLILGTLNYKNFTGGLNEFERRLILSVFKAIIVIVFILLLVAIAIPVSASTANPGYTYHNCDNHVISRSGDTISKISERCGVSTNDILAVNPNLSTTDVNQTLPVGTKVEMPHPTVIISYQNSTQPTQQQVIAVNPNNQIPAQTLAQNAIIPSTGGSVYIVKPGDNLYRISLAYNTTVEMLEQLNPSITDPNLIYAGQTLVVP
jgi:LysM repeat protein